MCTSISNKEKQKWVDKAINGDEHCPECKGELKDLWSASNNMSWLECDCGFSYVYENGQYKNNYITEYRNGNTINT